MSTNKLNSLPESLSSLSKLQILDMCSNKLSALHKIKEVTNRTKKMAKIALLCHGRKHKQYGAYFEHAIQIDFRKSAKPDIVHDLSYGMPKLLFQLDLIQTVYWPQLHKNRDSNTSYNIDLLKSIVKSLNDGGFFVFCHNGQQYDITTICEHIGLTKVSLPHVVGFRLKPIQKKIEVWNGQHYVTKN